MGKVIAKTLGIMWLTVLTIWLGSSSFSTVTVTATTNEFQSQPANNRFHNPAALVLLLGSLTALVGDVLLLASVINDLNNFEEEEENQSAYYQQPPKYALTSAKDGTKQTAITTEPQIDEAEANTKKQKVIPINRPATREIAAPLSQEEFYSAFNQDLWHN